MKLIPEVFAQTAPRSAPGTNIATLQGLEDVFANVVRAALALAGIAFFIMLIMGGFRYITSGGDPKGLEGAKNTLTFAVLGLVLTALAFLILLFIANFTGVQSILNFQVGTQ